MSSGGSGSGSGSGSGGSDTKRDVKLDFGTSSDSQGWVEVYRSCPFECASIKWFATVE